MITLVVLVLCFVVIFLVLQIVTDVAADRRRRRRQVAELLHGSLAWHCGCRACRVWRKEVARG